MEIFKDIAERILKKVESLGARAEIRINVVKLFTTKAENKKIKEIEAREERFLGLCVEKNGKRGFAGTTDFRQSSLENLVKEAFSSLRTNPLPAYEKKEEKVKISSPYKFYPLDMPVDEKAMITEELNKFSFVSQKIRHASTWIGEREELKYFISSGGSEIITRFISVGIRQFSIAKENGRTEKLGDTKSFTGGYEFIYKSNWTEFVKEISFLCEKMLSAGSPKAGVSHAILDPKALGLLLHESVGHASEADLACSGNSSLSNMLGKKVASEEVTIIDSGIEEQGIFVPYDDEGVKKEKTIVVEKGILKSFLHTLETARKCFSLPTGNARAENALKLPIARQCNYYMKPCDYRLEEMISELKEGFYISGTGTKGGHADVTTGSFTLSTGPCYVIKNGEINGMVKGVSIGGNIFDVLNSITAIGKDFSLHYNIFLGCKKEGQRVKVAFGGPHVKTKITIGGLYD